MEHLILVASFPTNKEILSGLIEFLEQHFCVHFIDIPGFTPEVAPLETYSLDALQWYIDDRVAALALDEYILGAISFGFLISVHLKDDDACKGIFALEPATGNESLHLHPLKRRGAHAAAKVAMLGIERQIWNHKAFGRLLEKELCPAPYVETTLRTIAPKAFFGALNVLLSTEKIELSTEKPVCLFLNDEDRVISSRRVEERFAACRNLRLFKTGIDHYPDSITAGYFSRHITKEMIEEVIRFIGKR